MLTFLCGTGHVVHTMFPIIADIALKRDPPGTPNGGGIGGIPDGDHRVPVSVAVVSLVSIPPHSMGLGTPGDPEILAVSVPASLFGVAIAALWSLRRGKI